MLNDSKKYECFLKTVKKTAEKTVTKSVKNGYEFSKIKKSKINRNFCHENKTQ